MEIVKYSNLPEDIRKTVSERLWNTTNKKKVFIGSFDRFRIYDGTYRGKLPEMPIIITFEESDMQKIIDEHSKK